MYEKLQRDKSNYLNGADWKFPTWIKQRISFFFQGIKDASWTRLTTYFKNRKKKSFVKRKKNGWSLTRNNFENYANVLEITKLYVPKSIKLK